MPQTNHNIRSEEVQDILTKVPHWMIQWGNTIILILTLLFFVFTWFIKYPDVIATEVIITSQIPPQKEYAQTNGKLDTLFVEDNQMVFSNEKIAIIENPANYKNVLFLKEMLDSINLLNDEFLFPIEKVGFLSLGEITPNFAIFKKEYLNYKINKKNDEVLLFTNLIQSYTQLQDAIDQWEQKYVLRSTINGNISFVNIWDKTQNIKNGELLFTVVPLSSKNYRGRIRAPIRNSGKIKKGQKVNIKLLNFPSTEYGILTSEVVSMSSGPNEKGFYLISIDLPNRLVTNYDIEIPFKNEMTGVAEIITEDLRLIERFFYRLRGIFSN